jgi:hypothetical protein
MLIAVDNRAARPSPPETDDCHGLELRWLARVDGALAGHHTLRALSDDAEGFLRRAPLPRWSARTAPWGATLRWSEEVRPRVLRSTDAFAERLGVVDTAAALVIAESGRDLSGAVIVEHELIVLAAYAGQALVCGGPRHPSVPECVSMLR